MRPHCPAPAAWFSRTSYLGLLAVLALSAGPLVSVSATPQFGVGSAGASIIKSLIDQLPKCVTMNGCLDLVARPGETIVKAMCELDGTGVHLLESCTFTSCDGDDLSMAYGVRRAMAEACIVMTGFFRPSADDINMFLRSGRKAVKAFRPVIAVEE
ncbi:hypothetical protein HK101_006902, partial [Irineochytrium annulatum]